MFVSFYSYKGGVGRTQLLANAASYLCFYKHKKVLLLEWDLEAPGLHHYFKDSEGKSTKVEKDGLIEVLEKYMNVAQRGAKIEKEELPFFTEENIINDLIVSKTGKGKVDLIPCANYSKEGFTRKLNDFDWREFTEMRDGNVFISFLKTKLKELDYDYIFIDSRTGIADYSGICNILLPDVNVVVVAPTDQNFEGSLRITKAISEHPFLKEGNRKPFILPILSRIDRDVPNYEDWVERFENEFGFVCEVLLDEKLKKFKKEAFRDLYIPQTTLFYNRSIALGENRLFEKEAKPIREISISKNYANIANYIDRLNTEPHLNFYDEITTELLENWLEENEEDLESYASISDTFDEIGNLEKSKEFAVRGLYLSHKRDNAYMLSLFYQRLGLIAKRLGDYEYALFCFQNLYEIQEKRYSLSKDNLYDLSISIQFLGVLYFDLNNYEDALECFTIFNELAKKMLKEVPENMTYKHLLITSLQYLGGVYMKKNEFKKAIGFLEKMKHHAENKFYIEQNIEHKVALSTCYNLLAISYNMLDERKQALFFLEKEIATKTEIHNRNPNNIHFTDSLAVGFLNLGRWHYNQNNTESANTYLSKAKEIFMQIVELSPTNKEFVNRLSEVDIELEKVKNLRVNKTS
ncbi:KGGVGR-motif variant AAA ATPase [Bernardetia sp.]|uniref:KGGVGR-motif variant AAA ATPase n=1 Tax=Bernardetia sp. TaxID=1937974 RepID=UPI0025BF0461|nr:AAA family ATPase [Bernardetia sp.]